MISNVMESGLFSLSHTAQHTLNTIQIIYSTNYGIKVLIYLCFLFFQQLTMHNNYNNKPQQL